MAFDKEKALAGAPIYWRGQKIIAKPRYQPASDTPYTLVRGGGDAKIDSEYLHLKDFWILGKENTEFALWDGNGVFKDTNCDAWGDLSTDNPEVITVTSEEKRKIGEYNKVVCWNPDCNDGQIPYTHTDGKGYINSLLHRLTSKCPTCFGKGYVELISY